MREEVAGTYITKRSTEKRNGGIDMHTQTCSTKRGRQPDETRTVGGRRELDLRMDHGKDDVVE